MKYLFILLITASFYSCVDDSDCQTCVTETTGGDVTVEFCQEGTDVIQTTNGVVAVDPIPNTTVEVLVATQQANGAVCN